MTNENDQMTILLALSSRTTYHTRMEYIHAPPLFLCLVSFLSHFGESWNLCSLVGVGINYTILYYNSIYIILRITSVIDIDIYLTYHGLPQMTNEEIMPHPNNITMAYHK